MELNNKKKDMQMLTKNNFKDFCNNLSDKQKILCRLELHNKEYIYIELTSYGDILNFIATDDDCNLKNEYIMSNEWDGNSYLIRIDEIVKIIGEK